MKMYYARLVKYKLGSGQRVFAERLTKEFDQISRTLAGFRGNVYFFEDTLCEYRALNYWDTKNDAENANQVLFPKLEQELENLRAEKPSYQFFEVFDPSEGRDLLFSHIKLV